MKPKYPKDWKCPKCGWSYKPSLGPRDEVIAGHLQNHETLDIIAEMARK